MPTRRPAPTSESSWKRIASFDQAQRLPTLIDAPLLYNWVFKGLSPLIPREELQALGYRFLLQADVLYAVSHALRGYFGELKATSSYGAWADRMTSFDEFNDLIGLQAIIDAEDRYEPARRGGGQPPT